MNTTESLPELIQHLADGTLCFEERAALLRNLDRDTPESWRDVALALVERDILTEAAAATAAKPQARPLAATGVWLAAACLALGCFLLGWIARPQGGTETRVVTAAPPVTAPDAPALEYPLPSASLIRKANAELAPTGYEASLLTRYVRTNVDGREVVIPISQVRLAYRGL